jgi:hypothetical protein
VNTVKRLYVDFNTLTSAPTGLVKFGAPGSWQVNRLPPLEQGEHVILYDDDGLEVDATVFQDLHGWWFAFPDDETWRDTIPASDPTLSSSHL